MRHNSETLRKWRESTLPHIDPERAIWLDPGSSEDLELSTRGETVRDKLADAIEDLRYPEARPNPNAAPSGWPAPLGEDAFHGPAGDIVRRVTPYTEASEEALLIDLLVSFGLMVGRGPYYSLGGSRQQPRLFAIVVGDTARGRKGAARGVVKRLTENAEKVGNIDIGTGQNIGLTSWTERHYLKGLTSGEGLISAIEDLGADGRVLVVEEEFARLITSAAREGSTMSPLIREAFDNNSLRVVNKNSPLAVSGAYVSIIGNITQGELMAALGGKSATETLNGFGNRFLYIASRRTKLIPETKIPEREIVRANAELRDALKRARRIEEMFLSGPASKLWQEWYYRQGEPEGLFGNMTARLDVQGLRLAMVYGLLDGSKTIHSKHLRAALEFVRYAEDSARYILGDATGNTHADVILRALRLPVMDHMGDPQGPRGKLTRSEIFALFDGNITREEIDDAVLQLARAGLVEEVQEKTGGRPRKVVRLL